MTNCGNQQQRRKPNLKIKKGSVIYGENDIKEYYEIDSLKLRNYAQSIAVQVPKTLLELEGSHYFINHEKVGSLNLCEDQDDFHKRLSYNYQLVFALLFLLVKKLSSRQATALMRSIIAKIVFGFLILKLKKNMTITSLFQKKIFTPAIKFWSTIRFSTMPLLNLIEKRLIEPL
jgi:hypothetical protein